MTTRHRAAATDRPLIRQLSLDSATPGANLTETFRRIYYHLYTNSDASRAERIVEDLSLILLLKLAVEVNGGVMTLDGYRAGRGTANDLLIPLLLQSYPNLIDAHQRFSLGERALRGAFEELSAVSLSNAPAHVLGDAFQALIGPRLRGDKGQFFTPRSLVRAMVEILAPRPEESVLDPACGTGGFLVEAHQYQKTCAGTKEPAGRLVGIDKDRDLARLAAALLRIAAHGRAEVYDFNSLDATQWQDGMGRKHDEPFDIVLTNPPFGARIGVKEPSVLARFDFGHQWVQSQRSGSWQRVSTLANSQDPQILFLELCVRRLKPGGRLGIVLPEGVFGNRQQGYVWEWLRTQGQILALLDCPRTTFQPGTDTKTNVLFFKKRLADEAAPMQQQKVRVAVALHCGHDRRGRSHTSDGRPHPDDFGPIARQCHTAQSADSAWREVVLRHPDYVVPRYYVEERPLGPQEAEITRAACFATLGELIEQKLLTIRKGHEVGSDAYGTGEIPFVRTSDIANFEISADPTKAVSEEIYDQYARQQRLRPGDILMVVDGRYRIGAAALLTENNFRCVVQSHFRILSTPRPDRLNPYELLYALNLPSVRMRVRDLVFVQSTLGTLGKRLLELRIPILHGDGPWANRIRQFREILRNRDRLLAEMKAMSGPDYEL